MLHRDRDEVVAAERHLTDEQLVQDDPERVDVGLDVRLASARLLGRDVVACSHHRPGLRQAPVDVERARDAEVRDLRAALLGEQHVLRLDVAMDETLLVREGERPRDLERELDGLPLGQRGLALDQRLQVLALDVLEDDELAAVLLTAVDHGHDVGMRELRHGAGLPAEALDVVAVTRELLVEDLQRDVPLQQLVVRAIDA